MEVKYEAISFEEAAKRGYPHPWGDDWGDESDYDDYDYRHGIWLIVDGEAMKCLGTDGGEPEDQTMNRDWSWIAPALNEAYNMGYDDASPMA
jgi:hypothetical protein